MQLGKNKLRVTVVTVVFNAKGTIRDTILSVLEQSAAEFLEYIIIDGGSTDGTIDIINEYIEHIDVFISEKDTGIYNAMNKGIALATGDYVLFLNSGDEFYSNESLSSVISQLSDCDILYGKTAIKIENNKNEIMDPHSQVQDWKVIPYCHQSVLIKSEILKDTPFNEDYKVAADYDQYFRLKNKKLRFKSIDIVISKYDNSGYSSLNYSRLLKEYMSISLSNHSNIIARIRITLYFFLKMRFNKV